MDEIKDLKRAGKDRTMKDEKLGETLAKLRDELKSVTDVDEPSRGALRKLDGDIHRILQNSGEDVPPAHHASLRESLEDSVEHFEASHPTITALMNRLLKALSDMGI